MSDFELLADERKILPRSGSVLGDPDFQLPNEATSRPESDFELPDFEQEAQQIIDRSPEPEETQEILRQAIALQGVTGMSWEEAFQKASIREDPKFLKGLKEVEKGWQSGWVDLNLGYVMYERMAATLGLGSKDSAKRASAEARVRELDELAAKIEKDRPKLDPRKQGLLWRALTSTSRMLPIMLRGIEKGGHLGLATGAGAAGMAAVLGQAGPQVGMPEEIVTVPGAFVTGFGVGTTVGATQHIMKIEAGLSMVEMLKEHIDPQVAAAASLGVGVVNGLLELAQINDLLKTFPGASNVLRRVIRGTTKELIKKGMLRTLARTALSMGKHTAVETLQELAQESVNIAAEELGKRMTDALRVPNIIGGMGVERRSLEPAEISQIVDRLKETAIDSALGFGVLQLPGTVASIMADTGKTSKAKTEPSAPIVESRVDQAVSEARNLIAQPEELTAERVAQTAAKLDAIIQSEASTPEEVVRAAQTADALELEAELAVEIAPGMRAETPEAEARALHIIAGGLETTPQVPATAATSEADIFNPISRDLPAEEKVKALQALSQENKPIVDAGLAAVRAQLGLEGKSSYKLPERIIEKATRPIILAERPWHDVEHIRDALRFKVISNTLEDFGNSLRLMLKKTGAQVVELDTGKVFEPKEWGWRFAGADLRMPNGQLVEFYSPLAEIEVAKKAGNHALFEKWRNKDINEVIRDPEQAREYYADRNTSWDSYEEAFEKAIRRLGTDRNAALASWNSLTASLEGLVLEPTRDQLSLRSSGVGAPTSQPAASLIREKAGQPAEIRPSSLLETTQGVKLSIPSSTSSIAQIDEAVKKRIREEVYLARESGMQDAEDFIREMKYLELPGEEKSAEYYREIWEKTPQLTSDEEAQRFLTGLSKEDMEQQVLEAVHNPAVSREALKLLAPVYQKISAEGDLTEEHFAELVRKIATQPRRWHEALRYSVTEETATYELARLYEAGLKARLPKQPGESLEQYRPLNVADILRQKDSKELEPVRKRIAQIVRTALRPPSGAINYEEAVKIQATQEGLDSRPSRRLVKTQERIRRYYQAHPNEPQTEGTRRFLARRFLGSMSYGELEAFDKQIRDLRSEGRLKRSLALLKEWKVVVKAQEAVKAEILKTATPPMKDIGSLTSEKKYRGSPKKVVEAYTLNMLRLARKLGPTAEAWLNDEVNKTLDEELRAVDRLAEPAKAKLKELGIRPRELAQALSTKDGVRYTVDQVIHMYLAIQNEDEQATLIHGNKVSAEDVAQLIKQLTPQQKGWGDYMLFVFAGDNFERLNRAYIEATNRSSHKVENYFPIRIRDHKYESTNEEVSSDLLTRAGVRRGYPSRSMLIERMDIPDEHRKPMRLGATAIFFEQLEKQEHFISHWRLARRLQNIFTRDKNLVETIASCFGRDWVKAIDTYINEVTNPGAFRANELRSPFLDALRSNITLGALAFNMTSLLNNLTGPMLYVADAGPLHMMSAAVQWMRHPVKLYEFVTERDPQVKHVSLDPVLENIRRRFGQNAFQQYQDIVARIGMKPLEAIDMWTRLVGWKAVYDKSITADKMSEAEAIQAAQKSTLRTQPSGRLKDMPLMYQDRAAQMFLMFTRQLNQIWNMVTADIPMDLRQGKIVHALADALTLSLTGLAIGTIGRRRLPEDPKEWVLDLVGQFISGIPLIGNEVLTGLQGYWWSGRGVNLWGFASTLAKEAGKRVERGGDLQDWANSFLAVVPEMMKMLGLPGVATGRIIHLIETGDPWELLGGRKK